MSDDSEQPGPSQSGQGETEQSQGDVLLPEFPTVTAFSTDGFKKIIAATRAFQSLPAAGPAWDLQKSYPKFNRAMKNARNRLVPMMSALLRHANIQTEEFRAGDNDEKFDFLVEANDDMLERIGKALDEASGLFKKAETIVVNSNTASASLKPPGEWGKRKMLEEQGPPPADLINPGDLTSTPPISNTLARKVSRVPVREKPQNKFRIPVDNSLGCFIPKLKEKPNSIKPLSILPEYNSNNEEFYGHPYLVELNKWEPSDSMLTKVNVQPPKKVEDTPLIEVKTGRDLELLLKDLYKVSDLSIDLEHHGYRSFLGLTCLMQISTREKDYIVDGLALREHLHLLNEIFTDPKIVKVLHGSSSDIEWLQKDFGLYIVNMFDTQVAAKLLGHQAFGLQALLEHYCNISQNKTFQMADWRIRPLPKEMIHYARQDTHFLLYIYDRMRNELIEAENANNTLIRSAYDLSKALCLKRYEKPSNNPKLALRKMRRSLNNRQVWAFTELYKWRDSLAREKDESIAYVLPNHMMLMIAEQLPKEMSGILACCDPVPHLVHSNLGKIHRVITSARELPLQEHTNEEKTEKREKLKDWVILMNSVHDVSLSEVSKGKPDQEKLATLDPSIEDQSSEEDLPTGQLVWPQPLKEPADKKNKIKVLSKPSIFFNHKISFTKYPVKPLNVKSEDSLSKYEAAATPFDRYQLSNEILDMMKDPIKKDALDMENPIIRAVYETVFCDPTEQDDEDKDDKPQVLEKVFADGEFIPFNPLGDGAKQSKKRKRKDPSHNPWNDDTKKGKMDPSSSTSKNVKEETVSDEDLIEDGELNSPSKMEEFFPLSSSDKVDGRASAKKNKKKKGKGKNFLSKLKNAFGKKKNKTQANREPEAELQVVQEEPIQQRQSPRKRNSDSNQQPADMQFGNKRSRNQNNQQRSNNDRRNGENPSTSRQTRNSTNQSGSGSGNRGGRGQGRTPNRGGRGKGRGGKFFEFKSRGGGRSLTFK